VTQFWDATSVTDQLDDEARMRRLLKLTIGEWQPLNVCYLDQ